jgi:hypothetical protein
MIDAAISITKSVGQILAGKWSASPVNERTDQRHRLI